MARTTISLPDDLRKEMDKHDERVNWSALAAQAFRSKLKRIRAEKELIRRAKRSSAVSG